MKRLFFIFLIFLGFFSSAAWATNTHHSMKFVFPFGLVQPTYCDPAYQTMDGCCSPPKSVYPYDSTRVGCCAPPNEVLGTTPNQRCCFPPAADQTRWGQTDDAPCGKFCTRPNSVVAYGTSSSCCPNCTGKRWSQSDDSVCGACCPPTKQVLSYNGGAPDCCTLPAVDQIRWGQTDDAPCGQFCTQPNSVVAYGTFSSCCAPLPADHIRFGQAPTNVCGDYVTCGEGAIPNADGTACVCDTANGYTGTWQRDEGAGNGCIPATCEGRMLAAGYNPANFKVTGNTITYTGEMTVRQKLNLTGCDLSVTNDSGTALIVNSGAALTAETVTGIRDNVSDISYGIDNNGTVKAKSVTGRANTGPSYDGGTGILNSGIIEADTVTGRGTGLNGWGIDNTGTVEAQTIVGNGTNNGIYNRDGGTINTATITIKNGDGHGLLSKNRGSIIKATNSITINSGRYGITNLSDSTIIAPTITAKGGLWGINNHTGGVINAEIITGEGGFDGLFNGGNYSYALGGTIDAKTVIGKGYYTGITNGNDGVINADTLTGKGEENFGIYNRKGTINAQIVTGTTNSDKSYHAGIKNEGTVEAPTIYYCPTTDDSGTLDGNRVCAAGCTCTD